MLQATQDEDILEWTMNMLQTKAAMDQAVGAFHSVCDKEIATKAAYKSMGLDPRDAPIFGWNMSERPRQSVNQTIFNGQPQANTASEQQPDQPVSPPPPEGGGGQASVSPEPQPASEPNGLSKLMKTVFGGLLIAITTAGTTYWATEGSETMRTPEEVQTAQELHTLQQQQLINKMQEVQAALKTDQFGTVNNSESITAMQLEICEELDSDPAFRDEIAADLRAIGEKILAHKRKRLDLPEPTPAAGGCQ
jgi:hypothetical protein